MDIETARKLAKNENTLPETLAQLANNKDYQIRQNVAANPNTPTEVLLNLSFDFPSEVMNNPVIPLLLIENPNILTCKRNLNFNQMKQLIDIEMKRLGWTVYEGRSYLEKTYGKRSRLQLLDKELDDFYCYLKSL